MNPHYRDVHSHLQFSEYDVDRAKVIARMKKAGVKTITVGVDVETSRQAIALAEQYPDDMWATVGVHPTSEIGESENQRIGIIEDIKKLAGHPKVVAIGECGLDYYRITHEPQFIIKELQKKIFVEQIYIAHEVKKPLMIHCRPSKKTDDAYDDLTTILTLNAQRYTLTPIVHFFVGSLAAAEKLLMLGCYFTFGGVITFARDYDEVLRMIPMDRILLETDAPYVAPAPYRGKRNEPAQVVEVAKKLAEIKGIAIEEVARQTAHTAGQVFGFDAEKDF